MSSYCLECNEYCQKEIARLESEEARLREALEKIARTDEEIEITIHRDDYRDWTKQVSKSALEGEKS